MRAVGGIRCTLGLALGVLVVSCRSATLQASPAVGGVPLTDESYEAWRDYLLPREGESAWREIPWRTTFADGLRDAAREERPLLLWVMNGHPLGST